MSAANPARVAKQGAILDQTRDEHWQNGLRRSELAASSTANVTNPSVLNSGSVLLYPLWSWQTALWSSSDEDCRHNELCAVRTQNSHVEQHVT